MNINLLRNPVAANSLMAICNATLVFLCLIVASNLLETSIFSINKEYISKTFFQNPTAQWISHDNQKAKIATAEMGLGTAKKRNASLRWPIKFLPLKKKNYQASGLPGKILSRVRPQTIKALPEVKFNSNRGPSKIDGTEKILAVAFSFNGKRVNHISWRELATKIKLPTETEVVPLVSEVAGPIGPVSQKIFPAQPKLEQEIVNTQNEISLVLDAQENQQEIGVGSGNGATDVVAPELPIVGNKEISGDIAADIASRDPFQANQLSSAIDNAIERETKRMKIVQDSARVTMSGHRRIVKPELNRHQLPRKKAVESTVNGQDVTTQKRAVDAEHEKNSLLDSLIEKQEGSSNALPPVDVAVRAKEITHKGIFQVNLSEMQLVLSHTSLSDEITYEKGRATIHALAPYSSFNVMLNMPEYLESKSEINLNENEEGKIIHVIKVSEAQTLLNDLQLDEGQGHILLKLEQTNQVSVINRGDNATIHYLDHTLAEVAPGDQAYVLISSDPGNVVVEFAHVSGQVLRKIFAVQGGEWRIDTIEFKEVIEREVALFTQRLMGRRSDYHEENSMFDDFQSDSAIAKRGPNRIEFLRDVGLEGRGIVSISEGNEKIYLGKTEQINEATLPSQDFRNEILKVFGEEELKAGCLIQFNIEKVIERAHIYTETGSGPIPVEIYYLDKDGRFGDFPTEETTNVFIKGQEVGALEVFFEGAQSTLAVKTYCSQSSYLVEQL